MKKSDSPIALTIAGLDPSGGAGMLADVRAFAVFNCSPSAVITSITFQNDRQVLGAKHISAETVRRQIEAVATQGKIAAVKVGMLPTADTVQELAKLIRAGSLPAPVLDPVMRSTSGFTLVQADVIQEILRELFPLAALVTPNIAEAEYITGREITNLEQMQAAAMAIREGGAPAVLIKGGHLCLRHESGKDRAIDILLDSNGQSTLFEEDFIPRVTLRGTGCSLSAAIAAGLAHGQSLKESVAAAKKFVHQAIAEVANSSS